MSTRSISRPLRIALVYDCIYPDSLGGVEHRNDALARALADRGHRVTLVGWHRPGAEDRHGGRVRVQPLGPPASLYDAAGRRRSAAALRFAWHCLRLDVRPFDVVETANIPFLHLPMLAFKCFLARRPLVVSWYEHWGPYWRTYLGGGLRWRLSAAIEAVCSHLGALTTASSRLTLERLAHRRRRNEPRLLPCGIDPGRIESVLSRASSAGASADAGAGPSAGRGGRVPPLIYAGRLLPEKRLDLLLQAVALLPAALLSEGPVLRVIGNGPDRPRLESLAAELAIQNRVELAGRLPSADDVIAALAGAEIAIQPSRREGFGLFPLEAMAAGLPVIHCTSPESAVGELVRDGREGLEVEPRPDALAGAIERLIGSEPERQALGAAARERARQYSWAQIAARAESLFLELLPEPGRTADQG